MQRSNLPARAGRWSAGNPKKAILGWLAFVLVAFLVGGSVGQNMLADEDTGNGESRQADRAIAAAGLPEDADEQILVQGRNGVTQKDPRFTAAIQDVTKRLDAIPAVGYVRSPLTEGNEGQFSKDGRSALIAFGIPGDDEATVEKVDATLAATQAAQRQHPALRIEQFGDASADKALSASFDEDFQRAEVLSVPITLIILLVAFGALVAAVLPLVLALTAVAATLGLLAPLSQVFPVEESISSVVLLIGLAVGVDYCMFYLRRWMEERDAGRESDAALTAAAATSGRAVLISGFTVMAAMAGMFFAGSAVFTSFAWGTIMVVAVALIGSLTVLPALLSILGRRGWIEKGRVPFISKLRHRNHGESRVWGAILDRVLRRPALSALAATALLVALTIPALGMHTMNPGIAGLPRDLAIMQTYDRITAAFPGGPVPAVVTVQADDVTSSTVQAGIADLERRALATGKMSGPVDVTVNPDKTLAIVSIPLAGQGTDEVSEDALATLRGEVIPASIARVPGAEAAVTG